MEELFLMEKMNEKATAFNAMLEKANADNKVFAVEVLTDEYHTAIFRSHLATHGQQLPLMLFIDDSIYTMIRTLIVPAGVTDANRQAVDQLVNAFNMKYKVFKYYVDEDGNLILDICQVADKEHFDPDMIRALLGVLIDALEKDYPVLMKAVWGNEAGQAPAAKAAAEKKN
jgi:hypothetical protein